MSQNFSPILDLFGLWLLVGQREKTTQRWRWTRCSWWWRPVVDGEDGNPAMEMVAVPLASTLGVRVQSTNLHTSRLRIRTRARPARYLCLNSSGDRFSGYASGSLLPLVRLVSASLIAVIRAAETAWRLNSARCLAACITASHSSAYLERNCWSGRRSGSIPPSVGCVVLCRCDGTSVRLGELVDRQW